MSNIGSTALQTSKQHTQTHPDIPEMSKQQNQFNTGTRNMLDEARGVVENAVGQGQELNPLIYQMLGLEPQYEDHSADLQSAQGEMDSAQKQFDEAQKTIGTIKGIPQGSRSPAQRQQMKQLQKQLPALSQALGKAKDSFGQLQTMPKTITGLSRMDPSQIPANSPFSSQNALNQAQKTESQRLNQYLAGGEVDPTLKHQYDAAESSLRAKLAQRFGPDFENTSVGQLALSNFNRTKNEAFATYNQQQVEKYNNLAFGGQANLQSLLGQQIGLMQEPSDHAIQQGSQLSNLAANRLAQQQTVTQWLLGHGGVSVNASGGGMTGGGGDGGLLQNLLAPGANGGPSVASQIGSGVSNAASGTWEGIKNAGSGLYNWATGGGAAAAGAGAAAGDAAALGAGSEAANAAIGF